MVAIDLDGTLLQTESKTIADVQAAYLKSLSQRGFQICIATGRAASTVYEHLAKLETVEVVEPNESTTTDTNTNTTTTTTTIPVVCSNGARGFSYLGRHGSNNSSATKELFSNPMPKDIAKDVITLCRNEGFAVQYYYQDDIYTDAYLDEHTKLTQEYMDYTGAYIHHVSTDDLLTMLEEKNQLPSKILVYYDVQYTNTAPELLERTFGSVATVIKNPTPWFSEVLNPTVNKGKGLQNMCDHLGIDIEDCIAIGDGCNDLQFLQMAGLGVAVKNAVDSLKENADLVLEWTNDEHAVMKCLQDLDANGQLRF